MDLSKFIRDVRDFPKKGIVFKDITPLLGNHAALVETVKRLIEPYRNAGVQAVAGIESRGFIFGALAAAELGVGFVPVRKKGKLPAAKITQSYQLEYGVDEIEMHLDAFPNGAKVLLVDDLLATGGTMSAACKLVEKLGGKVAGIAFVVELCFLNGRRKLEGYDVHSLIPVAAE